MDNAAPSTSRSVTWHIVWQAAEGRSLLASPALADRIRARLLDAHRPPTRALLHYLLTPNALHLLSRLPAGVAPGEVARTIANIVARWVRQSDGAPGNVFSGRYQAHAIESDHALRLEFRMLAWRPVLLGLCRAPTQHAHSSLRALVGLKRVQGFDVLTPLRLFGDSLPEARAALRREIARRPGPVDLREWELARGMARAAGCPGTFSVTTRPVRGPAATLVAASQPPGIAGALRLLERWVLLKRGHADARGLAALSVFEAARVRALVASLAVQLDLCAAAAVARHFGRAKATLSERMTALRSEPELRAILGLPLARVVAEAVGLAVDGPRRGG